MKIYMKSAKVDPIKRESIVEVETNHGHFYGKAKCRESDFYNWSNFFGCSIAETRAQIKAIKAEIKYLREIYKVLTNYRHNIMQLRSFNPKNYAFIMLEREIEKINTNIEGYTNSIINLEQRIQNSIKSRDEYFQERVNKNN